MTLNEVKQQTGCCKFAIEDVRSSKLIKQNIYDDNNIVVGIKETPMNEVFKKIVVFLNNKNEQVGSCLLNEVRANVLKEDPTALGNATFEVAVSEWGEEKIPLFKIVGKLYSNVFAI